MATRTTHHPFRQARQAMAKQRQALRDTRTPQQQIEVLDARFGVGRGATKERFRLALEAAQS